MTRPTEAHAREYLDNAEPWDLEEWIQGLDPEGTLDPWDLDAALVAEVLAFLTRLHDKGLISLEDNDDSRHPRPA